MQPKHKDALESLVDKYGAQSALEAIAEILSEKADHVRASYSDSYGGPNPQAAFIERASKLLYEAADRAGQLMGD